MKNFLLISLAILFSSISVAQTTLAAGDLAITGFACDNPDRVLFVLFKDITTGTVIKFTDRGWITPANIFRNDPTRDGTLTWTATSNLLAGTEIELTDTAGVFTATLGTLIENQDFNLSTTGDQILVYQGLDTSPTFIHAIHMDNANGGWSNATTSSTTALPPGLIDGVDAIFMGEIDNGIFICSPILVEGTIAEVRAEVADIVNNWFFTNAIVSGALGGTCLYDICGSSTTWDGVAWSNGTPTISSEVIIDADYSTLGDLPGSFDACKLFVNAGNRLDILGTDYVNVQKDVTIEGTITVASEANLVQINDDSSVVLSGAGMGVLEKTTTALQSYYSYTYWSSPFVNETIGEAGSGVDLVPATRIFTYDAANFEDIDADGFDDNANDWAIASGAMILGRGYAAFAQSSAMAFPQTQTYSFDGEFNNGVITTSVTTSVGAGDPNWNLLGNPYPSGLNADTFLTDPTNVAVLDGTIYLWTHNSAPLDTNPGPENLNFSVDDYASYSPGSGGVQANSGGVIPTGVIASGQGFFIEGLANGVATFNNAMRVTTSNDNFFRATDRIWLNMENDYGAFSQILIGFVEGATNGIDRLYDGKRLDAGSYISFFSLIDDEHYAIQGRVPLSQEELIPLGIKNSVEGDNEYKITIDNVEGLLETSEIFLVDKLLDITHDLNSGEYRFSSAQGEHKDRFELLLKNDIPVNLVAEELIITKNQDDSITFRTSNNATIQNIQIFDVLGRQLFDQDFNEEEAPNSIKLGQLSQTIFIAKATLANGSVLTKKGLK